MGNFASGPASYREHGHRVLLIWQHSLDPECNFLSELADSLSAVGKNNLAGEVSTKLHQSDASSDASSIQ